MFIELELSVYKLYGFFFIVQDSVSKRSLFAWQILLFHSYVQAVKDRN